MRFFVVLVLLIILGVGGFFTYQYLAIGTKSISQATHETPTDNQSVTKTGILRKGASAESGFLLIESDKAEAVSSTSIELDRYVGKKVEITGQYSGTTLYADSVNLQ